MNREDRLKFGVPAGLSGLAGIAIAAYILNHDISLHGLVGAAISTVVGVVALIIARQLVTNRTPHRARYFVLPWVTVAVGGFFVLMGAGSILTGADDAAWLLPPGIAAIVFGWKPLRPKQVSPSEPDGAAPPLQPPPRFSRPSADASGG